MRKILFTEGEVDSYFIQSLLKFFNLKLGINIEPKAGIEKLHKYFKSTDLIKELNDGNIQRFAIIADADSFEQNKRGFNNSRQTLIEHLNPILQELGIATFPSTIDSNNLGKGEIYKNQDITVGLWIMPNHQNDGYLETFISNTINLNQKLHHDLTQADLKDYATHCLNQLKVKEIQLFKEYYQDKANLYTWLAWQKKPTQYLNNIIEADLLDTNTESIQNFKQWLVDCFSDSQNI